MMLTPKDVQTLVRSRKVRDMLTFTVYRDGKQLTTPLKIGATPDYIDIKDRAQPNNTNPSSQGKRVAPNSKAPAGKAK